MPYSNIPAYTTYQTKRVDFMGSPNQRNGTTVTQDQRMVNFYPERIKDFSGERHRQYQIRTRPGTVYKASGGANAAGRGIFFFNSSVFTVIGNAIYRNGTTMGVTLGTSTGLVGWTIYNGTYTALILLDGVKGWVIKTDNSITQITDANFPTPHAPFPVFLDGYLFVNKAGTADIYNCNLEDPLTWSASQFITAELYPATIQALAKNNNYLYAITTESIEFFYDAGIVGGSPLQRNDSAVQQMGTPAPHSVVQTDKEVVFVGQTLNGGYTVWSMLGFQSTEIGYPSLRQALDNEGTALANAYAFSVRTNGHKFYVLQLTSAGRTFVYDFDEELWHEWSYNNDTTPFPFVASADNTDGAPKLIHATNGNVIELTDNIATDQIDSNPAIPVYAVVTTDKIDFGTHKRKNGSRLSIIGIAPQGGGTNTGINVQWTDDDYQTFSSAVTLNMNGSMSAITQLGLFRRRAFKFIYNQPYPLIMEAFEMNINFGNS